MFVEQQVLHFGQPLPRNTTQDEIALWLAPSTWLPTPEVEVSLVASAEGMADTACRPPPPPASANPDVLCYCGRNPGWR